MDGPMRHGSRRRQALLTADGVNPRSRRDFEKSDGENCFLGDVIAPGGYAKEPEKKRTEGIVE